LEITKKKPVHTKKNMATDKSIETTTIPLFWKLLGYHIWSKYLIIWSNKTISEAGN
jgi:hypothetical protein